MVIGRKPAIWRYIALLPLLAACATTNTPTSNNATTATPIIYDAAPLPNGATNAATRQIVIAENDDGVSTSWSSVTDNPAMRTATELSNLGGAPVVLGAVTAIVALDAKPKGRAKRTAEAINSAFAGGALDQDLATQLETALNIDPQHDAQIAVQPVDRLQDIPDDAWLVFTDYTLSKDGSALRATARVGHSADYRYALELAREARQQELMGFNSASNYRYQAYQQERRRRLRRAPRQPRYTNSFVYHSDRLLLPEPGDLQSDDRREELEAQLITALRAQRDARRAYADAMYENAVGNEESERKRKRAERRRDKAHKKADAHLAKALERATDGELNKEERLVLGAARWQGVNAEDGLTAEASRIEQTIAQAQAFFASALAQQLPGFEREPEDSRLMQQPPTEEQLALGRRIIAKSDDGRRVVQILTGQEAGALISLPDEGTAEYGRQSAEP
jgi:hypothetical protein